MTTMAPIDPTSTTDHRPTGGDERIDIPDAVSSSEAKLVYLYLAVRGTVTVDELGAALDLPKLALFSILGTLGEYDLIVRDGDAVSTV
ncbi:TrmB family transcriptional regulator [Salinigranum sp. GCM10025319]|uniref:TrmB family transcriptional regulator n=1 Tax=Salinigranum sp. GCM10025319 TaxID=3252687 RepID=UPI0036221051